MSKLKEDVRAGVLGAAAGLFAISVSLLIARVDAYYAYLSWLHETHFRESWGRGVEDLWWLPIGIWHLILSVAASLLVHRHLRTRVRSPFLLWQVIGAAGLLGWGLTVLLAVSMESLMDGNLNQLHQTLSATEIAPIAKYVSVAFACNVFYGSIIKASSRQYAELPSESPNVDHLLTTSK